MKLDEHHHAGNLAVHLRAGPRQPTFFTDSIAFVALSIFFVLGFLDTPGLLRDGSTLSSLKFVYFVILVGLFALYLSNDFRVHIFPLFPIGFFVLFFVSGVTFATARLGEFQGSYASALLPMITPALMLVIPARRSLISFERVNGFFVKAGLLLGSVHVAIQVLAWAVPAAQSLVGLGQFQKTFLLVFTFSLATTMKRWVWSCYVACLVTISMLLRPTSSLAAAFIISSSLLIFFHFGFRRIATVLVTGFAIAMLGFPIVLLVEPSVVDLILGLEPGLKESLGGTKNTAFRTAVLLEAREEILSNSILFGRSFFGNVVVEIPTYERVFSTEAIPGKVVPIHNDFVIMVFQGGVLGYSILVSTIVGALFVFLRGVKVAEKTNNIAALIFYKNAVVSVVLLVAYSSFNPIFQRYEVINFFWFIFLLGGARNATVPRNRAWKRGSLVATLCIRTAKIGGIIRCGCPKCPKKGEL